MVGVSWGHLCSVGLFRVIVTVHGTGNICM